MKVHTLQTAFVSGELDPLMDMRSDTGAYPTGLRRLRDCALLNTGAVTRRPGFWHAADVADADDGVVRPFVFDLDELYLIHFFNAGFKAYRVDAVTGGLTLVHTELGQPWTQAQTLELTFAQTGDTMIVCHKTFHPRVIKRVSLTAFTVSQFPFEAESGNIVTYQPFYKFADDAITLNPGGNSGTFNVTASSPYFTSAYVGTRLRIHGAEVLVTGYISSTVLQVGAYQVLTARLDIDPFRTTNGSSTVRVTHVAHGLANGQAIGISGAIDTGGITAANLNGTRTISVIDANTYQFSAGGAATTSVDGGGASVSYSPAGIPTRNWDEQVFSAVNGYPRAVCFHEQRLWFGGSTEKPDGLWSSWVGRYFNFGVADGSDNKSIQVTTGGLATVRHLMSNRHLQVFTTSDEYYAPQGSGEPLTPANFVLRRQTPYGIGEVAPLPFDGATLFLQNSKTTLREYLFVDGEASYAAGSLSFVAAHLLDQPRDLAVLYGTDKQSEQYAMLVNDDGTLPVFHSARAEKLAGWGLWTTHHPHSSGAAFRSIVNVGNWIFALVRRGTKLSLERMDATDDLTLDGASSYTGASSKSWTVSTRFANTKVAAVARGTDGMISIYLGELTVDGSGGLTLPVAVDNLIVGYAYTPTIETLPAVITLQDGTRVGKPKRINKAILALNSSLSVKAGGRALILRQVTDDLSLPPAAVTGKRDFYLTGYARDATVTITAPDPLPFRLLGMTLEVSA